MARRATKTDRPYNPVAAALVQSVAFKRGDLEPDDGSAAATALAEPPATNDAAKSKVVPLVPEPEAEETQPAEPRSKERGTERTEPKTQSKAAPTAALARKAGREKRVVLTDQEELAIEGLARELSTDLRTPVKLSNLLRACVILLREAKPVVRKEAKKTSGLVRPPNTDQAALAHFEHRLARILDTAFRNTKPLE